MRALDLPTPEADALALSIRLQALIATEIADQGPISFQRYMELALYAPGLGYYAAGARKFGAAGDFITAPELGSVFAQCIGQCIAPLLLTSESPVILELGAGSGALAADLLQFLAAEDALPKSYWILERSADLRDRQRQKLASQVPDLLDRVRWLEEPPKTEFDGVILANEVLDALACARFRITDTGVAEVHVVRRGDQLAEIEVAPRVHVRTCVERLQQTLTSPMLPGYASECVPELGPWVNAIGASLRRGLLLFIDYGYGRPDYYAPERSSGTLQCHYRHRVHGDPYWLPGLNDLTASVDFTAVAEAVAEAGFELAGFDHQSGFLAAAGIDQVFARQSTESTLDSVTLAQQIRRLMLPSEMGERFKVLAASRGLSAAQIPIAFAGRGQRHKL